MCDNGSTTSGCFSSFQTSWSQNCYTFSPTQQSVPGSRTFFQTAPSTSDSDTVYYQPSNEALGPLNAAFSVRFFVLFHQHHKVCRRHNCRDEIQRLSAWCSVNNLLLNPHMTVEPIVACRSVTLRQPLPVWMCKGRSLCIPWNSLVSSSLTSSPGQTIPQS